MGCIRGCVIVGVAIEKLDKLTVGQHQRMVIAGDLAQAPRFLLLDELTANLDIRHQVQVTGALKSLASRTGMCIVMIFHDLNIAARFADQVVHMAPPSEVHSVGRPEDVVTEDTIGEVYGMDLELCSLARTRTTARPVRVLCADPCRMR